jgi:acetoin utilization deacetylase AcuC-like enzyme
MNSITLRFSAPAATATATAAATVAAAPTPAPAPAKAVAAAAAAPAKAVAAATATAAAPTPTAAAAAPAAAAAATKKPSKKRKETVQNDNPTVNIYIFDDIAEERLLIKYAEMSQAPNFSKWRDTMERFYVHDASVWRDQWQGILSGTQPTLKLEGTIYNVNATKVNLHSLDTSTRDRNVVEVLKSVFATNQLESELETFAARAIGFITSPNNQLSSKERTGTKQPPRQKTPSPTQKRARGISPAQASVKDVPAIDSSLQHFGKEPSLLQILSHAEKIEQLKITPDLIVTPALLASYKKAAALTRSRIENFATYDASPTTQEKVFPSVRVHVEPPTHHGLDGFCPAPTCLVALHAMLIQAKEDETIAWLDTDINFGDIVMYIMANEELFKQVLSKKLKLKVIQVHDGGVWPHPNKKTNRTQREEILKHGYSGIFSYHEWDYANPETSAASSSSAGGSGAAAAAEVCDPMLIWLQDQLQDVNRLVWDHGYDNHVKEASFPSKYKSSWLSDEGSQQLTEMIAKLRLNNLEIFIQGGYQTSIQRLFANTLRTLCEHQPFFEIVFCDEACMEDALAAGQEAEGLNNQAGRAKLMLEAMKTVAAENHVSPAQMLQMGFPETPFQTAAATMSDQSASATDEDADDATMSDHSTSATDANPIPFKVSCLSKVSEPKTWDAFYGTIMLPYAFHFTQKVLPGGWAPISIGRKFNAMMLRKQKAESSKSPLTSALYASTSGNGHDLQERTLTVRANSSPPSFPPSVSPIAFNPGSTPELALQSKPFSTAAFR